MEKILSVKLLFLKKFLGCLKDISFGGSLKLNSHQIENMSFTFKK